MKRFVLLYNGQAFPLKAKTAQHAQNPILRAFDAQDGKELVKVNKLVTMASIDIANSNYRILDMDQWFEESLKQKEDAIGVPSSLGRQ